MTTDNTERRLRAALEASADLITEPPEPIGYRPRTDQPDHGHQSSTRSRRLRSRWARPLLAAAAVVVVAVGATAIVQTVNTHQAQPVAHTSSSPVTSPSPSPSPSTTVTAEQPLVGPQVSDAELFAGGHGFVRTQHSLLWTDDLGATWRDITPPGTTAAQLRTAAVSVLPDGHQWVTLAPASGSKSVTLLRRSSTTQPWTRSSVPLGELTIPQYVRARTSLSFVDADNGWLMINEAVTHESWGELLHTTDGGATWTVQAGRHVLPAVGRLHFLTPTLGYLDGNSAMGAPGWWATKDAGKSWTRLRLPIPPAKKSDTIGILGAPTRAGDAIVVAASYTTPVRGSDDGVGIYRSTDGGTTWTVRVIASATATEEYSFAATGDGSAYVLLRSQPAQGLQTFTWVTSHSSNGGRSFTDKTSVHNDYPGPLTLADPGHLWTLGGADDCKKFKTGCRHTAALIASNDGGATWHQVKLPS